MKIQKDIEALARDVKQLFIERTGGFNGDDFKAVAADLGFAVVGMRATPAGDKECATHTSQQSGEGFWAVAPGAGDVSEGMVWVGSPLKNT